MVFFERVITCAVFFVLLTVQLEAQRDLRLSAKGNLVIIRGTSSLHDWQCRVEQMSGQMVSELAEGKLSEIRSLQVSFVVTSIRSIKENGSYYEASMDKNVYKALNSDKHATITFNMTRTNSIKPSLSQWLVDAVGVLRISGTSKEIALTARAMYADGGIVFEGKVPLRMTDFKVDPPTALFGTIKTGNEVSVEFKLAFHPVK